ncbi:MAG TPA: hypothetical protein VGM82_03095 [Gemmatimonadaceae bacterium]
MPSGASITILAPDRDPANVTGQLEQRLIVHGFTVISALASGSQIQGEARTVVDSSGARTAATVGIVRLVHSDFALRFSYTTRAALGTADVFETFAASVIDAKTGRVVATGSFGQGGLSGRQVSTVLDEFVDQLTPKR